MTDPGAPPPPYGQNSPPYGPYAQPYGPYAQPSGPYASPYALAKPAPHPLVGVLAVVVVMLVAALAVGGIALAGTGSSVTGHGALADPTRPPGADPVLPPDQAKTSGVASATQQSGIVTILSTLQYQNAKSAGTGMVISRSGEILTNNHVIRGATRIQVTVESTGRSYRADVVGTAPGSDVAVLKLRDASKLTVARLADTARDVRVGDRVIGVGNARGTGTLKAAGGRVTGLNRAITASDETGQSSEKLTGLIQVNARIVSGDSGGPLYDATGRIIGINTAAARQSSSPTAYSIPIDHALDIVRRIETGTETTSIHLGYPGFLGVSSKDATNRGGALVVGLLDGGPAEGAGITAGATITRIDGTTIRDAADLRSVLTLKDPGSTVSVTWTTSTGTQRTASMTLGTGPAD